MLYIVLQVCVEEVNVLISEWIQHIKLFSQHLEHCYLLGLNKSGLRAIPGTPPKQRLAVGQLAAPPLIPGPLPPSPGIILACPLSPSSRLPSSFLNLCSSAPHLRSRSKYIGQHLLLPPLLLAAAPYSLLHSRSSHLFFSFRFPHFCTLGCCWC
jgi:hypothetical protein